MAIQYVILAVIFLFCFPFILSVYVFYDASVGRLNFSIYLFSVMPIFGGFLERKGKSVLVHYANKKAKEIKFKDRKTFKFSIKDISSIELFKVKSWIILPMGAVEFFITSFVKILENVIYPFLLNKKYFLSLNNDITLSENEVKGYLYCRLGFNLISVITIIVRKIFK